MTHAWTPKTWVQLHWNYADPIFRLTGAHY
ncbi:uncharacterized protein METZ01_LOCUS190569 [marine metagenome]|uniref:Uncharacterized protein n=1 Tax=marine metagenome TaxID=408172 RepID=A0A382DHI9_9ZZZZ